MRGGDRLIIILVFGLCCWCSTAYSQSGDTSGWRPSPTGAAFRSLFVPGWGQAYTRHPLKAVIYGGLEEGLIYGIYRQHQLFHYQRRAGREDVAEVYRQDRNRLTWMLAGVVILSVTDAYVDAHLYGFDVSEKLTYKLYFTPDKISAAIRWRLP